MVLHLTPTIIEKINLEIVFFSKKISFGFETLIVDEAEINFDRAALSGRAEAS